jgi:hypothetical protein
MREYKKLRNDEYVATPATSKATSATAVTARTRRVLSDT